MNKFAEKKIMFRPAGADSLTCGIRANDVHLISEAATGAEWNGDCAVYRHANGDLVVLPIGAALPVSLKVLEQDILTISPVKVSAPSMSPITVAMSNLLLVPNSRIWHL